MSMSRFGLIFLFLVLLASQELVTKTEGFLGSHRCGKVLSSRFKGKCLTDHNCDSVCQLEGYVGGDCHGVRRRCFCNKKC
ncbi:hypothetical protein Lal_00006455 [Lupinus albus]|uniref:Putative knottin, scorpion toxin n=1 Tax=Lupinus albus TaxID=3870 RepID=A0A6A4QA35_LUPAL|nr:putative knottin, scorpion toxin [Lupinus albus]KAF1875825.1 hypothetical protein Lal_00006455 [Lupinus albus]